MLFRHSFRYLFVLLAGLLAGSCIRYDRDDCRYPVSLHFLFTHNVQGQDLFDAEGIDNIHLFVYDYQNRLTLQQQLRHDDLTPDNTCRLMLPMGSYTLIAWAGDLQGDTYRYESPETLTAALVKLQRAPDGTTDRPAGKLFHGICIPLFAGNADKDLYEADLRKNTNDLRVIIKGIAPFTPRAEDFDCTVTATNGDYTFDNHAHGTDRVRYIPRASAGADGEARFDFTMLRLWDGDDSRLRLTYRPAANAYTDIGARGETVIYDGSLSKLLLKKPNTDLDLEDEFELVFTIDKPSVSTDVSLTVNGWEVIDHNSGL